MDADLIEFSKGVKAKCDKCESKNILLFVETRIKDCFAWACYDCQYVEVRAKPETLEEFFKKQNVTERLP